MQKDVSPAKGYSFDLFCLVWGQRKLLENMMLLKEGSQELFEGWDDEKSGGGGVGSL